MIFIFFTTLIVAVLLFVFRKRIQNLPCYAQKLTIRGVLIPTEDPINDRVEIFLSKDEFLQDD